MHKYELQTMHAFVIVLHAACSTDSRALAHYCPDLQTFSQSVSLQVTLQPYKCKTPDLHVIC